MAGERKHIAKQGDCLYSLAARYRIPVAKIQRHPDNSQLIKLRPDPSFLLPGDAITIPAVERKEESAATGQRHRFVYSRPKIEIRIKLSDLGQPLANEPYYVEIERKRYDGHTERTSEDGLVVCEVPADTDVATVVLGDDAVRYELHLGCVDPPDTDSGLNGRLSNLGYLSGQAGQKYGAHEQGAMARCLHDAMGKARECDQTTREKDRQDLIGKYGC